MESSATLYQPTPLQTSAPLTSTALTELSKLLDEDMGRVNALILEKTKSSVQLITILAEHLISAGGKRIRPLLTLASAALFGYEGDEHIKLATAVEFIHTATLLHDDVVDESTLRRGKETSNAIWGNQPSVLVGDYLFAQAFHLMVETESLPCLKILSGASATIVQGEVKQLISANNLSTSADLYKEIISAKTAELFRAACEVGAVLNERTPFEQKALREYGKNLGLMFQITDDILDYFGSTDRLGKSTGDDFKEGKVTLPIIFVYQDCNESEKTFLRKCFEELVQVPGDFETVRNLMEAKDTFGRCYKLASLYAKRAKESLNALPKNLITELLRDLTDYCLKRMS